MKALPVLSYHPPVLTMQGEMTVRAVFDRAWHLQAGNGHVLTITTAPYDGPSAVRVAGESLRHLPVTAGMIASFHGDLLHIGNVQIHLSGGRPWIPPSGRDALPIRFEALRTDAETLRRVSRAIAPANDSLTRMLTRMDGLLCALLENDPEAIHTHTHSLIGLGPGVTPAGDDALVGLLVGLHLLGDRLPRATPNHQHALASLRQTVAALSPSRTTRLSHTLLFWACHGLALQPLIDVLCTLGTGNDPSSLDTLLGVGHTSGRDMLLGSWLAVTAVLAWEEATRGPSLAHSAQHVPRLGKAHASLGDADQPIGRVEGRRRHGDSA